MFTGIITALVTPFRNDAIDETALRALVDDQIEKGVDGLVPVGTTGESPTLNFEEHIRVIKIVIKAAAQARAGHRRHRIELDRRGDRAVEGRAQASAPTACCRSRPTTTGPTQERPVPPLQGDRRGRAAADDRLQRARPHRVRSAARDHRAPRRAARRWSASRRRPARRCARRRSSRAPAIALVVLSGDDATAFPLFALGARGCISVVSNVAPAQMCAMWDAAAAGDWTKARELHYRLLPLSEGLFVEAEPDPGKAALAMMGRMADEMRPPLYPLSGAAAREAARAAGDAAAALAQ